MGVVLELEFSCSFQQMLFKLENNPPLELSQDWHTWNHTCKLEVCVHDETYQFVHIYSFLNFSVSVFLLFMTFWCFTWKNFQHIFPPISDNNSFSFSIIFLIQILAAFNCRASNSISHGLISRLIHVLLPLCDMFLSLTVNMLYLAPIYQPW